MGDNMTKEELTKLAEQRGIDVDGRWTKAEIQKALDDLDAKEKADKENADPSATPAGDTKTNVEASTPPQPEKADDQQIIAGEVVDKPATAADATAMPRPGSDEPIPAKTTPDATISARIAESFRRTNPAPRPATNDELDTILIDPALATLTERPADGGPVFEPRNETLNARLRDLASTYTKNKPEAPRSDPLAPSLHELNMLYREDEAATRDENARLVDRVSRAAHNALSGRAGVQRDRPKPVTRQSR